MIYTNEEVPIDLSMRWEPLAARIIIEHDGKEIRSKDVSSHVPEVEFTWGENHVSGETTISWNASDEDGDSLFYELWYSYGEEGFDNIVTDYTKNSITIDMDNYPGAHDRYFYLYASDGISCGETYSVDFTNEFKAPTLYSEQTESSEYKITDEVYFSVDIYGESIFIANLFLLIFLW